MVSDIPLLFESADPAAFDAVVLVDAPEAMRLSGSWNPAACRLTKPAACSQAQMPRPEKRDWVGGTPPRAPFVIENEVDRAA